MTSQTAVTKRIGASYNNKVNMVIDGINLDLVDNFQSVLDSIEFLLEDHDLRSTHVKHLITLNSPSS